MEVDPLASMRCWAIEIELGGRTYDVPALPAVDWWPVLVSSNPMAILDFVVSNDLDERLLDRQIQETELVAALRDAVEEATGRSFHISVVLAMVASQQWAAVGGVLAQKGFRWDVAPIGAALDAVYSVVMNGLDEESQKKFLALLENESLTTGEKKASPRAVSEFESMAGPRPTGGLKATGELSGGARPKTRQRPRPPRQAAPSTAPRRLPGTPAGSAPAAIPASPPGEAGPASDTGPPPPP